MSDDDSFSRPSKRRRRDSFSPTLSKDRQGTDHRNERQYRNESPQSDRRKRIRSPNRTYTSRDRETQRSIRSSGSEENDKKSEHRRRRSRSKSCERTHDRHRDSQSHRKRDRSSSPRPSRHRKRDSDRDKDRDRGSDRNGERNNNRTRSRERTSKRHSDRSPSPKPYSKSKAPLPSQNDAFAATADPDSALEKSIEKQRPNFGLTGKLAAASNTIQTANQTIVLKYHEPPESRKPPAKDQWRLYVFKGDDILDTVELSEQSCWLFGREAAVADFPIEHLSCSKQHAVVQFRYLEKRNEFGDKIGKVKPYLIDLESANGTMLNEDSIPAAKYVELRDKDVIKFGQSTREYVIQLPASK